MTTRLDGPLKREITIDGVDSTLTTGPERMTLTVKGPRMLAARQVLPALLVLPLLFAAPVARAQIFKCVSKEGRVAFQDSPCIGSTGTAITVRPANSGVVVVQPKPALSRATASKGEEDMSGSVTTTRPTQAQRDAATLKAMETDRRRRSLDRDLGEADSELDSLKSSMEQNLAGLRARKDTLSNSVPGSPLEQNAASDLQIASDRYQTQIRAAQDRVAELKKARDDLTGAAKADSRATSAEPRK